MILLIVMVAFIAMAATLTPIRITDSWKELTPTTIATTGVTELTVPYPVDGSIGVMVETSSATGTITLLAGDWPGALLGSYSFECTATKKYWLGPVESWRYKKYDGYIYINVSNLNGSKFYVFRY